MLVKLFFYFQCCSTKVKFILFSHDCQLEVCFNFSKLLLNQLINILTNYLRKFMFNQTFICFKHYTKLVSWDILVDLFVLAQEMLFWCSCNIIYIQVVVKTGSDVVLNSQLWVEIANLQTNTLKEAKHLVIAQHLFCSKFRINMNLHMQKL